VSQLRETIDGHKAQTRGATAFGGDPRDSHKTTEESHNEGITFLNVVSPPRDSLGELGCIEIRQATVAILFNAMKEQMNRILYQVANNSAFVRVPGTTLVIRENTLTFLAFGVKQIRQVWVL
jgi:hypothetical protein